MTGTRGAGASTALSPSCSGREVRAFWVTTGTAANCLALAALCPPYRGIVCHQRRAYRGRRGGCAGLLHRRRKADAARRPGREGHAEAVAAACDLIRKDVHQVQPAAISITNATEYGLVYRAAEVAALGELAKERGLGFPHGRRAPRQCARRPPARASPTSPGAPASTPCRSASSRTAGSMPRR